MKKLILASGLAFLVGCATNMKQEFEDLKMGMDKTDVLDSMGSPAQSEIHNGVEYWKYVFYHKKKKMTKEVQFRDGLLIYKGEVTPDRDKKSIQRAKQKILEKELKGLKNNDPKFQNVED